MTINTTKRTRKVTKHGGVASKKIKSSKTNTVSDTNSISKYLMPVHNVQRVPLPKEGVPLCQQGNGQLNPDCDSACNERSDGLNDIDTILTLYRSYQSHSNNLYYHGVIQCFLNVFGYPKKYANLKFSCTSCTIRSRKVICLYHLS